MRHAQIALTGVVLGMLTMSSALAQQSADDLAKQLSNPVAALISVPLQLNFDGGAGATGTGERWTLNIQPVVPVSISDDWNLISRTILPIIGQHDVLGEDSSHASLGDIVQSVFFSPKAPTASGWIWGVGPVFLVPTGADGFTQNRWGAGPTAVALRQVDVWSYGVLANHLWDVTHDDDNKPLSATFLQPFVSRGMGQGMTVSANLESTYDWTGRQWTVPGNVSVSQVSKFGTQLVSLTFGARYYFVRPFGAPEWGLRASLTLLYPR